MFTTLGYCGETWIDGQTNSGHIIQEEGTTITQDPVMDFVGAAVTASRVDGETQISIDAAETIAFDDLSDMPDGDIVVGAISATSLNAGTGAITTTGTAFLGLIDLGTNTIDDGAFTGAWAFNSGNLSGIGTLGAGAITATTVDIQQPAADTAFNVAIDGVDPWFHINQNGVGVVGDGASKLPYLAVQYSTSLDRFLKLEINATTAKVSAGSVTAETVHLLLGADKGDVTLSPQTGQCKFLLGTDQNFWMWNFDGKPTLISYNDAGNAFVPMEFYASTYVFNNGNIDAKAGNFTTTGTAFLGLIDLGTNTIDDGAMTGDWDFGSGNLTTTGTGTFGESLQVNANEVNQVGLELHGIDVGGPFGPRGGFVKWFLNDRFLGGYTFMNDRQEIVFDTTIQATSADQGNAFINVMNGSAGFAGGDLTISSTGELETSSNINIASDTNGLQLGAGQDVKLYSNGSAGNFIFESDDQVQIRFGTTTGTPFTTTFLQLVAGENHMGFNPGANLVDGIRVFEDSASGENRDFRIYGYPTGESNIYGQFKAVAIGGNPYFQISTTGTGVSIPDVTLIGDGGTTNYTEVKADGEINLHGTARITKSIWLGVQGIKAPGTKPAKFKDWGISGVLEFSDGTDDTVIANLKFPEDMDRSVAPTFTVGWSTNTAVTTETCTWQIEYLYTQAGEDVTAAAQETLTVDSNAIAQADGLIVATITGLDVPNAADVCMHCRIKRLGAGGNDDLTDTAEMSGVCLSYTACRLGTAT